MSEAYASDFVLKLVWDSRRLRSCLCAWSFRRVFSRARVPESRATDERGDPELEGYLLGREDTEFLFSSVLDICFALVLKGPRVARVNSGHGVLWYSGSERLKG